MARAIRNSSESDAGSAGDSAASKRRPGLLDRLRGRVHADRPDQAHPDLHVHERVPAGGGTAPVADLDDASFEAGTEGAWTVVDFWAPWCGPCRAFHPVFDQVALDTPEVRFARCDVETSARSAAAVGIQSLPTVVLFDPEGNEADRIVGVPPRKAFNRLLARATSPAGGLP